MSAKAGQKEKVLSPAELDARLKEMVKQHMPPPPREDADAKPPNQLKAAREQAERDIREYRELSPELRERERLDHIANMPLAQEEANLKAQLDEAYASQRSAQSKDPARFEAAKNRQRALIPQLVAMASQRHDGKAAAAYQAHHNNLFEEYCPDDCEKQNLAPGSHGHCDGQEAEAKKEEQKDKPLASEQERKREVFTHNGKPLSEVKERDKLDEVANMEIDPRGDHDKPPITATTKAKNVVKSQQDAQREKAKALLGVNAEGGRATKDEVNESYLESKGYGYSAGSIACLADGKVISDPNIECHYELQIPPDTKNIVDGWVLKDGRFVTRQEMVKMYRDGARAAKPGTPEHKFYQDRATRAAYGPDPEAQKEGLKTEEAQLQSEIEQERSIMSKYETGQSEQINAYRHRQNERVDKMVEIAKRRGATDEEIGKLNQQRAELTDWSKVDKKKGQDQPTDKQEPEEKREKTPEELAQEAEQQRIADLQAKRAGLEEEFNQASISSESQLSGLYAGQQGRADELIRVSNELGDTKSADYWDKARKYWETDCPGACHIEGLRAGSHGRCSPNTVRDQDHKPVEAPSHQSDADIVRGMHGGLNNTPTSGQGRGKSR